MIQVDCLQKAGIGTRNTSSKGNQNKWCVDEKWYKEDGLGYEALAEIMVSKLLYKSDISHFVTYEYEMIQRNDSKSHGCASVNFMKADDDKVISVERLFMAYKGTSAAKAILSYEDTGDRIRYIVETVEEITGLVNFGYYIRKILTLDTIFLNEDRHFHNIAVIQKKDGTYRECPIFDHGAALFSDVKGDYPLIMSAEECLNHIQAKPFSRTFDEQLDACELIFPQFPVYMGFTMKDVEDLLEGFRGIYEDAIIKRVKETMRIQIQKYGYLFK